MEHGQKCLYEILGIERTSTPDEIRAAYRKLALKHHPDKLVQSGVPQEEATARFQEILRAYEVLSDPRERSWYDSHRSQILYSSSSSPANSSDFDLNLWPYFSTSVYSGYGETGKGFFKVYGDLFNKLFQQEVAFAHAMEGPRVTEAPLMGNLGSPYSQVSAFYNYWVGFCTVKDFSWVDEYRASLGPNRKTRRLMEEENKKLRKKARREYNETVRQLAEFVKKRDKRVLERQIEKKREQTEKEALSKLRRKQLERERLEKAMQYEEPEWTKIAEEEEEEEGEEEDYGIRGGGNDGWYDRKIKGEPDGGLQAANQELYCVVCSKKFKSDKQWKNHEQSKKHRDRVLELRDSFVEEDTLADGILKGVDEELDSELRDSFVEEDTLADGILKGVDEELDSRARADDLGIGEALESSAQADDLGSDKELDFKVQADEPRADEETYSRARSDDDRIDEDLDVRAQVDGICNLIGDMLDLKEDGVDAETASVTDIAVLNKTEDHEGVNSDIEHYGNVDDISDESSYHTIAEDEKTEIESNAEDCCSDGEQERENGHMDDEGSLLEAMLKTHRTKQGANNVYKADIALTEIDDSDGNYRANARQAGSKNQRNRKQQGFAPRSSDLIQSDMNNGAEIDAGTSSRASQRQGSKKMEKQKRKQAAVPAEHSVMGAVDRVKLGPECNVGVKQGGTGFSSHVKGEADTIEVDKEKRRLQEPAKQSANRTSATSNSSMKEMSAKGKKHAKVKKGKGIPKLAGHTCETCGEDFDSRNQLFTHLSGTGHAMLKSR